MYNILDDTNDEGLNWGVKDRLPEEELVQKAVYSKKLAGKEGPLYLKQPGIEPIQRAV